ncbi:BlaI/MecI/CopY family transcriptional regulator [Paenibacillus sp. FSL E2-0230]|uniref:BlaI/MecI/CopY family transcriptional regulator n=1 Tax=Paenibacillus sp. FSL E2-0230 TaxID=2954727 RepID=UPI0030D47EAE
MNNKIKRLPDAELEIMLVIWRAESWVSSSYILNQLGDKRKWALATLMTVLSRLVEKGFSILRKRRAEQPLSRCNF